MQSSSSSSLASCPLASGSLARPPPAAGGARGHWRRWRLYWRLYWRFLTFPLRRGWQRERQTLQFLFFKSIPECGEVFEEVSESTLQPGDVLLFPFDTTSGVSSSSFRHAAVYCGEGEVIHFQNTHSWGKSGRIIKEGFRAMKKQRGKCQIYRKKSGIDLNDFRSKVKEAMNSEANYYPNKNNCIHFALYLLDLVDFYMQLVEIQNEGGSCGSGAGTHPHGAGRAGQDVGGPSPAA